MINTILYYWFLLYTLENVLTLIFLAVFFMLQVRTNLLLFLVALEMLILTVNIKFVYHSIQLDDFFGFNFCIVLLILAAAETAIGVSYLCGLFSK